MIDAPVLFKHADDSTIVSPVNDNCDPSVSLVEQFLAWSKENSMSCNPRKCKKLIFRKKSNSTHFDTVYDIPQCSSLVLLGVLQSLSRVIATLVPM